MPSRFPISPRSSAGSSTEVGRQPWIVYGVMRTSQGVSGNLRPSHVAVSLIAFTLIYGLLAILDIYLLAQYSRKSPEEGETGRGGGLGRGTRQETGEAGV